MLSRMSKVSIGAAVCRRLTRLQKPSVSVSSVIGARSLQARSLHHSSTFNDAIKKNNEPDDSDWTRDESIPWGDPDWASVSPLAWGVHGGPAESPLAGKNLMSIEELR